LRWLAPYQLISVAFYFQNKMACAQFILEADNDLNVRSIVSILGIGMVNISPPLTSAAEVQRPFPSLSLHY
jgi:hypothetical protein